MNICKCGERPRLVEYYIKGSANHKNYFVKCDACRRRTRSRRLKQAAIDEWNEFGESKYMKWQDGISDYYGFRSLNKKEKSYMDVIEIFDRNNVNTIATLNAEFYPIPPTDSMIYFEGKCYVIKKIIYDIDEHKVRIMVAGC